MPALPSFKDVWGLLREAGARWVEHKASRLGAALAYYTVFMLAPLLVIVIAIAGFFFGADAAKGRLSGQIESVGGNEGGNAVQTMVASAGKPASGTLAAVLGIVMLVVGAAGLFGQLQDALHTFGRFSPSRGVAFSGFSGIAFCPFR